MNEHMSKLTNIEEGFQWYVMEFSLWPIVVFASVAYTGEKPCSDYRLSELLCNHVCGFYAAKHY